VPSPRPLPLWAGRTLALAGIILVALNMRTAVAAISPIAADIAVDIPLSSATLGVLGALPPIMFALAGFVAPLVARRLGLETSIMIAAAAMVVGSLLRGLADNYGVLLLGSVIALGGMGFGNILLPPAVKRYFPDRIALLTTVYLTVMAIGASVPAVVSAPIAGSASWRLSLALWAIVALPAVLPWLVLVVRSRLAKRAATGMPDVAVDAPEAALLTRMLRSRVTWAMGLTFAVSSLNAYATFAWLPSILTDLTDVDAIGAGALLAVYGLVGFPLGLIVPMLAARMRNVGLLIHVGVAALACGYLGLLFAPGFSPLLWVLLIGSGPLMFPVCLVLINLRTRSHHTSIALSGLMQTIGYTIGAIGAPVVGFLHAASDGWTVPLIFLLATALVGSVTAVMLARPRFIEDDLATVSA